MRIDPIGMTPPMKPLVSIKEIGSSADDSAGSVSGSDAASSFGQEIKKAIGHVNKLQNDADTAAVDLSSGDVEDVHKAMIAMQKAKLALDFTIQVRNKVIDAYQEIMRMQV